MRFKYLFLFLILFIVMVFAIGCAQTQKPETPGIEKTFPSEASEPEMEVQNKDTAINEPESASEKPQDLNSEIGNTQAEPAAETLSFSWEKDSGPRMVDGSVPFVHGLKDGEVRL